MVPILLYFTSLSILLIEIFGTKSLALLENPDLYLKAIANENVYITWLGRIGIAAFIMLCTLIIAQGLLYRKTRFPKQGLLITASWLGLYIPPLLSSIITETGKFSYKLLLFPLFLIAIYLSPRTILKKLGQKAFYVLMVFIYISLLGMLINPTWAYTKYLESWIGIPIRLFGASSHPNSLGAIAFTCLILLQFKPSKTWLSSLHHMAVIAVLVLTQSKTVWLATMIWIAITILKNNKTAIKTETLYKIIGISIFISLLFTTYILLFEQKFIGNLVATEITLTGRTSIWKITLSTWLDNPIFGYGPNIWDIQFRKAHGYLWAGQAHNQLMQTIGESGLFGITSLLMFYLILIRYGSKYYEVTNHASFGILILTLIRSFTETPIRNYDIDSNFLINVIFFIILINSENDSNNFNQNK
jgi:O-antigen ligase